jgi:dephospho-CoA kinase
MEIEFKTLENAQNIEKIIKIFSHNTPKEELQSNTPTLIILVGSPGVGKTTKSRQFLNAIHMDSDNFYNVSLDSIVEHVKPYREITKELYDILVNERGSNKLSNNNTRLLSNIYLQTIKSKRSNLGQSLIGKSIIDKIIGETTNRKLKPFKSTLKSLNELKEEGLIYGIKNNYNIIYDTTLNSKKDKIKEDIMPLLEKYADTTYNIITILVEAPVEDIKQRIKKRHDNMLKEGYIRSIGLSLVEKFVKENKEGFIKAKKYFEEDNYIHNIKNSNYTSDKFSFHIIQNPTVGGNKTRKRSKV